MRNILILLIRIYQKSLSPDHGWFKARWPYGYCRFYPTCSQYGVEALKEHGTLRGSFLTVKRIIRCNPFSQPGVDQVPKL